MSRSPSGPARTTDVDAGPVASTVSSAPGRDPWDVASWVFGPRRGYRLNTSYRHDDGAVVTACGRFDTRQAAADLAIVFRPFELLGSAVHLDLCHAVLDVAAARVLVGVGLRRSARPRGFGLTIANADPTTRALITSAGGVLLLRPPRHA